MAINNFSFDETTNTYIADPVIEAPAKYELEIGDIKSPDNFFPQMKWKTFDNECNFSVRLYSPVMGSVFNLEDGKVKWVSPQGAVEVYMYEVETNPLLDSTSENDFEFGGCEFEAIFNENPGYNEILFTLKSKNIKAWYQGEPDADSIRPDHVIGSYAIYHSSKKHNEYGCGKLFHIYRPKVIDSTGAEAWCELLIDIEDEFMKITIPQDFLDNAVYPVKLDPTTGYTTAGATLHSSVDWSATAIGAKVTSDGTTNVPINIIARSRASASSLYYFKCFICSSDGSIVSNSVSQVANDKVRNTATSLNTSFANKLSLSTSTIYYLCATSEMPSNSNNGFYYDSGGDADQSKLDTSNSYTTPESITGGTNAARNYTIYFNYAYESGITNKNKLVTYYNDIPSEAWQFAIGSHARITNSQTEKNYEFGINGDYAFIGYFGYHPVVTGSGYTSVKNYNFAPYLDSTGKLTIKRYEAPNTLDDFNSRCSVVYDNTLGGMFTVQRGSTTLSASSTDTTSELSTSITTSRSFITAFGMCNEDESAAYFSSCDITSEFVDSTHIKFKRIDDNIDIIIYWEVIEFTTSSGITVESVEIDTSGDLSTEQTNSSLTFQYKYSMLIHQYRCATNEGQGKTVNVYINSDNEIKYRRYTTTTEYTSYLKCWLIKFPTRLTNLKTYEYNVTNNAATANYTIDSTAALNILKVGDTTNFNYCVFDGFLSM
jgi:hypothetical protein